MLNFIKRKLKPVKRSAPTHLILDTDGGCDDIHSLLLLFHYLKKNPSCKLLGITTLKGNCSSQNILRNIKLAMKLVGVDYPVYKGCQNSMSSHEYSDNYFGQDGLCGKQAKYLSESQKCQFEKQNAVTFIAQSILKHPGQVTLICIGPLTNLATALVMFKQINALLKEVIIMGGTMFGIGNVPSHAGSEFNSHCDGVSAEIVYKSVKNILTVTFELALFVSNQLQTQSIFNEQRTVLGKFVNDIYQKIHKTVCDPLAVFVAFQTEHLLQLDVTSTVAFEGGTTRILSHWITENPGAVDAGLIFQIDNSRLQKVLVQCLQTS